MVAYRDEILAHKKIVVHDKIIPKNYKYHALID